VVRCYVKKHIECTKCSAPDNKTLPTGAEQFLRLSQASSKEKQQDHRENEPSQVRQQKWRNMTNSESPRDSIATPEKRSQSKQDHRAIPQKK
jgi:hypothetical protein